VVLGHALQQIGYEVVLVAAENFRAWVEARGISFAGLSVNIQAMLDAQASSRNPLQTMRWMRAMTQATVQMGREITDMIRDDECIRPLIIANCHDKIEEIAEQRLVSFVSTSFSRYRIACPEP